MSRPARYLVSLGSRTLDAQVTSAKTDRYEVALEGRDGPPLEVLFLAEEPRALVSIEGRVLELGWSGSSVFFRGERRTARVESPRDRNAARPSPTGATGSVRAPMPGRVVKVLVAIGDAVAPGAAVVIVEAMKMENELFATLGGSVRRVLVRAGDAVERGAVLVEIA